MPRSTACSARSPHAATREEAMGAALDSIRDGFGWAYGSYWAVDPADAR